MKSYIFQVESTEDVWRTIKLGAEHTLDNLSQEILRAFGFDDDHLYGFFMDGKPWSEQGAFWSPYAENCPSAGEVTLSELHLLLNNRFLYLYDFGDEWIFKVQVKEILNETTRYPVLMQSKGEAPEQYLSYDDDDEYEDDDE